MCDQLIGFSFTVDNNSYSQCNEIDNISDNLKKLDKFLNLNDFQKISNNFYISRTKSITDLSVLILKIKISFKWFPKSVNRCDYYQISDKSTLKPLLNEI